MLRALFIAVLAGALSGCWVSEEQLFGGGDWVVPAGIEGAYVSENPDGEQRGTVDLVRRKDGMIAGTATRNDEPEPRTSAIGFVAIPGGSGHYFLMVQPVPEDKGGELYLIGRWQEDRLEAYWPQCAGTPDMAGMTRDTDGIVNEAVCGFSTKQAVLKAALVAERELSNKRMFDPQMLGRLRRSDEPASELTEDVEPES